MTEHSRSHLGALAVLARGCCAASGLHSLWAILWLCDSECRCCKSAGGREALALFARVAEGADGGRVVLCSGGEVIPAPSGEYIVPDDRSWTRNKILPVNLPENFPSFWLKY